MEMHANERRNGKGVVHVPIEGTPVAISASERLGKVFVACNLHVSDLKCGRIYVFDTVSASLVGAFSAGVNLTDISVDEATGKVFALDRGLDDEHGMPTQPGSVLIFDQTGMLVNAVEVGPWPKMLIIHPPTQRAFATCYGFDISSDRTTSDTLYMMELSTGSLLTTIAAGFDPIAASITQQYLFVASFARRGTVAIIDTQTGTILQEVPVGDTPSSIGIDEQSGRVFVTNSMSHSISIINPLEGDMVATISVNMNPISILVDAHHRQLFIIGDDITGLGPKSQMAILKLNEPVGSADQIRRWEVSGVLRNPILDVRTGLVYILDVNSRELKVLDATALSTHDVGDGILPQQVIQSLAVLAGLPIEAILLAARNRVVMISSVDGSGMITMVEAKQPPPHA